MVTVLEMECWDLARIHQSQEELAATLILDCRPFLAFSRLHLRESRNVNWNSVLRRRSRSSAVSLQWLLPDRALRGRLSAGDLARVLVLDEGSAALPGLKADSLVVLLLNALLSEIQPGTTDICFLKGGFESFYTNYPELCSQPPALIGSLPGMRDSDLGCSARNTPLYDQGGPVEILPFLYLGSAHHSSQRDTLESHGITALLNVSSTCPNYFEGQFRYKCIPVEDSHMVDISIWFQDAIEFIDSVKNSGGRVLVHCQAGISRSATICLAYLMRTQRVRLEEAFDFIKQRRGVISPNFGFMGQLLQFETQVLCH
ncbi:dual specificity protein phosphatase 2 [Latimeria chalumnae]|nr:PREDICTED: dual specificity protein phosphatase 2 [Latimeria chalumnae]|eukprot:XP_006010324.1 PREDICTED: dual specificity protein phosphatase 2 [Latimeria chalumnae]